MIVFGVFCLCFVLIASNPVATLPCPCATPYNIPSNNNPNSVDVRSQTDSLNQLLLAKILTNPSLQKILDPTMKLYNQNGLEIQRQPTTTPNVINNYFIVPPEFFNLNDTKVEKVSKGKKNCNEPENFKNAKAKGKHGTKRSQNIVSATETENVEVVTDKRKRRKKKNGKKAEKIVEAPKEYSAAEKLEVIEEPVKRKKKLKSSRVIKPKLETIEPEIIQDPVSKQIPEIDQPRTETKTKKKKRGKTKIVDSHEGELRNIEEPVDNLDKKSEAFENRNTRNSKNENNRRNVLQNNPKMPPIPDDILKSFYPYLNTFYPGNLPFNFDQFYPYSNSMSNKRKNSKNRPKNNNVKSKNVEFKLKPAARTPEKIIMNETTELTKPKEPITVTTKPDSSPNVTEQGEYSIEVVDIPDVKSHKEDKKENYEMENENIEDLHEYITPEFKKEDSKPIYNNVINDYYPVFYDSSLDEASDEGRGSAEELTRDRRKYDKTYIENDAVIFNEKALEKEKLRNKFKASKMDIRIDPKVLEKYTTETQKAIDEINKIYPVFEPDFETKQVEYLSDESDEANFDKITTLPAIRRVTIPSKNTKPVLDNVETVFAKTKVVKYGIHESNESTNSDPVSLEEDTKYFGDGTTGTTYVVAKSLGKVDDYYY